MRFVQRIDEEIVNNKTYFLLYASKKETTMILGFSVSVHIDHSTLQVCHCLWETWKIKFPMEKSWNFVLKYIFHLVNWLTCHLWNYATNKKVLLRECKRQESHCPPRSKCSLCWWGRGYPIQSWTEGYPLSWSWMGLSPCPDLRRGYYSPSTSPGQQNGVPPVQTWDGVTPPPPRLDLAWGRPPPPPASVDKLQLLPSLILRMRAVKTRTGI